MKEINKEFNIKDVLNKAMENCDYFYNKEEGLRVDIIRAIDELYNKKAFIMCEYTYSKGKSNKSIDMVVCYNGKKYAIELKYRIYNYNLYKNKFDYKTTEGCNMYEYTNDIATRILDKNLKKEYKNIYAIILTNHKNYHNKDSIMKANEKCKNKDCKKINANDWKKIKINKYPIEKGYYSKFEKDFYFVCAEK